MNLTFCSNLRITVTENKFAPGWLNSHFRKILSDTGNEDLKMKVLYHYQTEWAPHPQLKTLVEEVPIDHFGQNYFFVLSYSSTPTKNQIPMSSMKTDPPGLRRFIVEEVHFYMLLITN